MKPTRIIDGITTEDGRELVLSCHDGSYQISLDGLELMNSRTHRSEHFLASLACAGLTDVARPRVLVGGLGLGYTLRSALDHLPPRAVVTVAEVFPAVVEWNRGPLGPLAGHPLDDRRVIVLEEDVTTVLTSQPAFDSIMLDVDNGPEAFTLASNDAIYSTAGIERLRRALRPGGVLAVWSAGPSPSWVRRLNRAGLQVRTERVKKREKSRSAGDTIFLTTAPGKRSP